MSASFRVCEGGKDAPSRCQRPASTQHRCSSPELEPAASGDICSSSSRLWPSGPSDREALELTHPRRANGPLIDGGSLVDGSGRPAQLSAARSATRSARTRACSSVSVGTREPHFGGAEGLSEIPAAAEGGEQGC